MTRVITHCSSLVIPPPRAQSCSNFGAKKTLANPRNTTAGRRKAAAFRKVFQRASVIGSVVFILTSQCHRLRDHGRSYLFTEHLATGAPCTLERRSATAEISDRFSTRRRS